MTAVAPLNTEYEDLLRLVMSKGSPKPDRTGTGTRSVFGHQMRFDLAEGFPLITTKRVHFRSVAIELLWFLRGDSNVTWLRENGVTIWDEWAGPTVTSVRSTACSGAPGRRRTAATSTRSLAARARCAPTRLAAPGRSALERRRDPADGARAVSRAVPVPRRRRTTVCQLYQRSADLFLGVPFNIASYALLTHMVAQQVGLDVGEFIWTGGDCHIYDNHVEQVDEQLSREIYPFPRLRAAPAPSLFDYTFDDMEIVDYRHHPALRAPVAV